MSKNIEDLFSTSDLALASAISMKYSLCAINKSNPEKALFLFQRDGGLDDLIQSYWSNSLMVSPLAYFQQLKILKSRLYEQG
jgi:hypothetical protein